MPPDQCVQDQRHRNALRVDQADMIRLDQRSLARFEGLAHELREDSGVDPEFVRSGILRVATDAAAAETLQRRGLEHGDALEWLAEDSDLARTIGKAGREKVIGDFTTSGTVSGMATFFDRVFGQAGGAAE